MRFLVLTGVQIAGIALAITEVALLLGLGLWIAATVAILFLPPEAVDDLD